MSRQLVRDGRHFSSIIMRIGIVGGLDRNARDLQGLASARGHQVELHTGVLSGPASSAGLRALVSRADLVLILTDINSHNAVRLARREAKLHHRPWRILRRLGASQFTALLQTLGPSPAQPAA